MDRRPCDPARRFRRHRILTLLRPREHGFLTLTLTVVLAGLLFAHQWTPALALATGLALLGLPLREALRGWSLGKLPLRDLAVALLPGGLLAGLLIWLRPDLWMPLGLIGAVMGLDLLAARRRWYRRILVELAESTGLLFLLWLFLLSGEVPPGLQVRFAWGFGVYLILAVLLARALRVQHETLAFHYLWAGVWTTATGLSFLLLSAEQVLFLALWTLQVGALACLRFRGQQGPRAFQRLGWFLTAESLAFVLLWAWLAR